MSGKTYLYRLFDSEGRLLYIGISKSLMQRLSQHQLSKSWAKDVSRVECVAYEKRSAAEMAEIDAIGKEGPLYNIQHQARETAKDRQAVMDSIWNEMSEDDQAESLDCLLRVSECIVKSIQDGEWATGKNEHMARSLKAIPAEIRAGKSPSDAMRHYFGVKV